MSILLYNFHTTFVLLPEKCTQMCPLFSNEYIRELDTSDTIRKDSTNILGGISKYIESKYYFQLIKLVP